MNKFVKGSLIFASGAAIGFAYGSVKTFCKMCTSETFHPYIAQAIKDKVVNSIDEKIAQNTVDDCLSDIVFSTFDDAEKTIGEIQDLYRKHNVVTISDVLGICDLDSKCSSSKFGWTDISKIHMYVRDGYYYIHFDKPVHLDQKER